MEEDIQECKFSKEWNCEKMSSVKSEVMAEDTRARRYSRSEMEGLRFVDFAEQQRKWSYAYQNLGYVAKELSSPVKSEVVAEDTRFRSYSRSEMEGLRFVDLAEQQRKWSYAYQNLGSVAKEYEGLRASNGRNRNKQNKNKNGEMCSSDSVKGSVVLNLCDDTLAYSEPFEGYEDAADEDDSSSDECESILRPAFYVEGEPDFESGPPLDGLEYLRRVRWEAAQIPKVKVVKLQSSKITNEQTPYMPQIPEIAKCPPNLLPSKLWEDAFLAYFSELRQAISLHEEPCGEQSVIKDNKDPRCEQSDKTYPTFSSVLSMDVLSRSAALRKRITMLETASSLSKDDCVWLFTLCAAVDTPLSAETCASLRCLLRKCSSLLALKSERDDEVAMLSILIAIVGKYFKQSDNI